jgi:DNA polymerase-3 subunit delta
VTPDELERELAEGRLRPAYLLLGEEALLRDDALRALRAAALAGSPADFDFDALDGEATGAGALEDALRTLPVLAPRRLVVLREPAHARAGAAALLEALARRVPELAAPEPVVLVVASTRADRRTAWVRAFGEPRAVVECAAPKRERELVEFVRREATRQGVRLEAGAAELLAERVGPQLLVLRQEIAKLGLLVAGGGAVTRQHVAGSASDLAEEPIWDLTDAIGEGRAADALALLHRLLAHGAPPPVVLAALASHVRKLVRVSQGGEVAGPPFVVRKLQEQARRSRGGRLLAGLAAVHDADEVLKGRGSIPAEIALERLVLALAS